jgi:hypothetical protein
VVAQGFQWRQRNAVDGLLFSYTLNDSPTAVNNVKGERDKYCWHLNKNAHLGFVCHTEHLWDFGVYILKVEQVIVTQELIQENFQV